MREATRLVGSALHEEAKKDSELMKQLASKRFVIVDSKGTLKLTNLPQVMGIGRIRLSTKKILAGKY